MKESFMRLFVLVVAIALATPGFAAGKKKKEPEYHDTVIASVSANSIVITEDKATKTFPITQFTEITLKGQRATLADLKPGMAVSVTIGTDGVSASRISAGDPPVHFAAPKATNPPKGWQN
ncbi:MAG: hypothetical protein ACXWBS_05405 [Chthoniobacterales bacterium]